MEPVVPLEGRSGASADADGPLLQLTACAVDLSTGRIRGADADARLSDTELALIRYLALRPGEVIGRDELYREVWAYHPEVVSRAVDLAVARARSKLERDPASPDHLLSVRRVGYRLVLSSEPRPADLLGGPLPAPSDPLVGRAALVERACAAFATSRVVAVVGGPGIGKTRVALAVAARVDREARWLGPDRSSLVAGGPTAPAHPLLLVVDDLDPDDEPDVVDALAHLLVRRPELWLLTTSRTVISRLGGVPLEVEPLDPDAALELLVHRAGPADPAELRLVAGQVERLPLALELAAALIGLVGAGEAARQLGSSLAALEHTGARTLSAAIAPSWEALTDADRRALVALTPFRGGFTTASAAGRVDPETLLRLRGRSWLHRPAEGRFALFRAIREHVLQRADPAEVARAEDAHAEGFAAWLREVRLGDDAQAVAAELGNLRAALATLEARGRRDDAVALLEQLIWHRWRAGDHVELRDHALHGLALAADPATRARFEVFHAVALRGQSRMTEAVATARAAVAATADSDPAAHHAALLALVDCCMVGGLQGEAEDAVEDALALAPHLPPDVALRAEVAAARVVTGSAHPERALDRLDALEPRLEAVTPGMRSQAAWVRAVAWLRVDPERAVVELERLEHDARAAGRASEGDNLARALAVGLLRCDRAAEAEAALDRRVGPVHPPEGFFRAWVAWLRGDLARCAAHLGETVAFAAARGDRNTESHGTGALGLLARDAPGRTVALLERARALHPGSAHDFAAWAAVFRVAGGGSVAELDRVDPETMGGRCGDALFLGGPWPALPVGHEFVDRIGLERARELASPRG